MNMKRLIIFFCLLILPINGLCYDINAKSLIVMEKDSNRVLLEKNAYEKKLIASTTKIMTAVLAIESGKLYHIVTIGEEVLKMYGSNIYIEYGENLVLLDLVYGLMLRSGNDAAVVIANYIGDSEERFVEMMNKKAKELGMNDTIFMNPHGLDEETQNYSTAYDMALLTAYASSLPMYLEIAGTTNYRCESDQKIYVWKNRVELLNSYEYLTSGKTGYTPRAGRVLATTATKDELDLVIVGFGNDYGYELHRNIYEDMFSKYRNYLILDKSNFSTMYNEKQTHIKNSFYYPLTSEEREKIKIKIDLFKKPNKVFEVGEVYVYLDDDILHKEVIYIEKVKLTFWQKIRSLFTK